MRFAFCALLSAVILFAACSQRPNTVTETADEKLEKNLLWFDATANFHRFTFKDSITFYLEKSKDAGVTDVVIDIKPITGEVLYPSRIAPVMTEWKGEFEPGKKDTTWDMLAYFIEEGHRLGLAVHASANVFVAGHNYFDRGVVYEDATKEDWQTISYLPQGMTKITDQKKKYSAMLNPVLPEVQEYELNILKEIVTMYPKLDGIILDRVRFDGIAADFSSSSREMFESYIGEKVANFPEDIFSYSGSEEEDKVEGPLYKKWLEWRAKIVHDFIYKAKDELKVINPDLSFGDYTGAWYPLYFDVGVNFASKEYDPSRDFDWATPEYKNYGYAEALDLFTTGNYYFEVTKEEAKKLPEDAEKRTESGIKVGSESWYTVEGSAELVNEITKGKVPVYAGLYVEQYIDNPDQFVKALKMCREKSNGSMVFDIVHIINYGWWDELKRGLTE